MEQRIFKNRREAGQVLAARLEALEGCDGGIVLALPRGGVPVAFGVSELLGLPLDLMLVRKLGLPDQEELAMGALASGGVVVYNDDLLRQLAVSEDAIARVIAAEQRELQRRDRLYRGDRPPPQLQGRCVILVDDGIATGATMRAAIAALRQVGPRRVVVAVPVAPPDTVNTLRTEADEVVCLSQPAPFVGVGRWYADFAQTEDEQVKALLRESWSSHPEDSRGPSYG